MKNADNTGFAPHGQDLRKPLLSGPRNGYKDPSPSVFVTGTTQTIGNTWSSKTSGSVRTTQGYAPRCSCSRVGSRDTHAIVPRIRSTYSSSVHPLPGTHLTLLPAWISSKSSSPSGNVTVTRSFMFISSIWSFLKSYNRLSYCLQYWIFGLHKFVFLTPFHSAIRFDPRYVEYSCTVMNS